MSAKLAIPPLYQEAGSGYAYCFNLATYALTDAFTMRLQSTAPPIFRGYRRRRWHPGRMVGYGHPLATRGPM